MTNFVDRKNVNNNWVGGKQGDSFSGAGGDDLIHGGGGDDTIHGDAGNDRLYGDDGHDSVYGGAGIDLIDGGAGNDDLRGDEGNDTIVGGAGIDALLGGMGADVLTGGAGSWDEFDYLSLSESSASGGIDRIIDYNRAEGDKIMFLQLDANANATGLQGWNYIAGGSPSAEFNSANGQATLVYDAGSMRTTLNLYNNDGDVNADFTLILDGQYGPGDIQISVLDGTGGQPSDAIVW